MASFDRRGEQAAELERTKVPVLAPDLARGQAGERLGWRRAAAVIRRLSVELINTSLVPRLIYNRIDDALFANAAHSKQSYL